MSDTAAPIELAPQRRSRAHWALHGVRMAGRWVHLALALAIVLGVFVQVYLIGAYIFGAGQGALDAHKTAGWTVHGFELLVFVAAFVAWLPRHDLALSLLLAVVGTVQVTLASEHRWSAACTHCWRSSSSASQQRSRNARSAGAARHVSCDAADPGQADNRTRPGPRDQAPR